MPDKKDETKGTIQDDPATTEPQVENGWLIEKLDASGNGTGRAIGTDGVRWEWVPYDRAIRFARKQDAEAIAGVLIKYPKRTSYKAIEHSWG